MEPIDFLVCVRCFTFNHASYIEDAMNGFCMQKTNFPYVCVIVDDASTDGEHEVIMNYLQSHFDLDEKSKLRKDETDDYVMTFAQHKINSNCYFAIYLLKYNHYSINKSKFPYIAEFRDNVKYNAFCEGDDYWINPQKLQKQVDYLESHLDYGMCLTDFNLEDDVNNKSYLALFKNERSKYPIVYDLIEWITHYYYAAPMTWLIRRELMASVPNIKSSDGTYVYYAYFLYSGKVYCLKDVTAVYRRIAESASNTLDPKKLYKREEGMYNAKIEMAMRFLPEDKQDEVISTIKKKYYSMCLKLFVALGKYEQLDIAEGVLGSDKSLAQKFLLSYPRNKYATYMFFVLYKNFIRIRKKILRKV